MTQPVSVPLYLEDLVVATTVPTLIEQIDPMRLFMFSAATFNPHRIHYDERWTVETEGFAGLVVQGPLQSALLTRMVTSWIGPLGRLLWLEIRHRSVAHCDAPLECLGEVIALGTGGRLGEVDLSLECRTHGKTRTVGAATVQLPSRPSPIEA